MRPGRLRSRSAERLRREREKRFSRAEGVLALPFMRGGLVGRDFFGEFERRLDAISGASFFLSEATDFVTETLAEPDRSRSIKVNNAG